MTPSTAAEPARPAGAARKGPRHHGSRQAERHAAAQVSPAVSLFLVRPKEMQNDLKSSGYVMCLTPT